MQKAEDGDGSSNLHLFSSSGAPFWPTFLWYRPAGGRQLPSCASTPSWLRILGHEPGAGWPPAVSYGTGRGACGNGSELGASQSRAGPTMNWDKLEWDLPLYSGDTDTVFGKMTHHLVDFSAFVSSPVLLDDNGARSLSQELSPTGEVENQSVSCGTNVYSIFLCRTCVCRLS